MVTYSIDEVDDFIYPLSHFAHVAVRLLILWAYKSNAESAVGKFRRTQQSYRNMLV